MGRGVGPNLLIFECFQSIFPQEDDIKRTLLRIPQSTVSDISGSVQEPQQLRHEVADRVKLQSRVAETHSA